MFVGAALLIASTISGITGALEPGTYYEEYVDAGSNNVYWEYFNGTVEIELVGYCENNEDIDLWVYDEWNNLLAKSTTYGCWEYVNFWTSYVGVMKIVVENSNKPRGAYYDLILY